MPSGPHSQPARVFVAPLDWGLGHATRCIPIIRRLLQNGEVVLGGSGPGGELLQQEFPDLPFVPLPAYNIRYAARPGWLPFQLLKQVPRILGVIQKEQSILREVARTHRLTAVISDNRFGLHHPGLRSVYITHQLTIAAPFPAAETLLRRLHHRYIRRFSEVWVPDVPNGLSGRLGRASENLGVPVRYVGALSRFRESAMRESTVDSPRSTVGKPVVLLSGPEPQRTLLEQLLLPQLAQWGQPCILVRGLPAVPGLTAVPRHGPTGHFTPHSSLPTPNSTVDRGPSTVDSFHHLPARDLLPLLQQAPFVLARSGYSTVMDLAALSKKAILIPTPGQTEQEYLARHLQAGGLAHCPPQKGFHLEAALTALDRLQPRWPDVFDDAALEGALQGIFAPS